MTQPLSVELQQTFGFSDFRTGQLQTIEQLLDGQSSLAIFPTGSGKSLCYQFTALQLPHLTLVVSPLLALMKDQLAFLRSKGIRAESIDSSLTPAQNQQVMADVKNGEVKILMVSVERFKNERFRHFIQSIAVSMLVVDEAHCISEWGHNFRPDYLKLPHYQKTLNIPLTLLLTATATKEVKVDIANKFNISPQDIVQTGFYRDNLNLSILPVTSARKQALLVEQIKPFTGVGIVYVTLQQSAETVASFLQNQGINAQPYHAGFESDKRTQIQHDFMNGKIQVIVATIAFGMGIDKSDIRFVIHYDLPKSIENYSQEIGRAGRDGQLSHCITLANLDGLTTLENFVYGDTPELSGIERVIETIKQEVVATHNNEHQWELQGLGLSTASNIKQLPLKTLLVQLELRGVIKPLFSYFADFKYKFIKSEAEVLASFDGERSQFLAAIFDTSTKKRVWAEPDFERLFQRYQSKRERVITALEYLSEKQMIALETKRITDVYQINVSALHTDNLAQDLSVYFHQKEHSEIARIAALVDFFQSEQCLSVRLSHYFDDINVPTQCGHCSVCLGHKAVLQYSVTAQWPADEYIHSALQGFIEHIEKSNIVKPSIALSCRFLTGLSVPAFSRNKVRQLTGFGLCEQFRYAEVEQKVKRFLPQLS